MFKAFAPAAFILTLSIYAHANDSAFPRIEVKAISPGSLHVDKDVVFYGVNADSFFDMLPAVQSSMPAETKKMARSYRFLAIESGKNAINISCSKIHNDKDGNEVKNPNGTECRIALSKPETDSDHFDFNPKICK